jgi:hypothetical protein
MFEVSFKMSETAEIGGGGIVEETEVMVGKKPMPKK